MYLAITILRSSLVGIANLLDYTAETYGCFTPPHVGEWADVRPKFWYASCARGTVKRKIW